MISESELCLSNMVLESCPKFNRANRLVNPNMVSEPESCLSNMVLESCPKLNRANRLVNPKNVEQRTPKCSRGGVG